MEIKPVPAHIVSCYSYFEESGNEVEAPLDMSIKRKPQSVYHQKSYPSDDDDDPIVYNFATTDAKTSMSSEGRSSVITWNDVEPHSPPPYHLALAQTEKNKKNGIIFDLKDCTKERIRPENDHERHSTVQQALEADPLDPEIDEHFRRSLGFNCHQLSCKSATRFHKEINDSVDDHFLKALGSTWTMIKEKKMPDGSFSSFTETSSCEPVKDSPPNYGQSLLSHISPQMR